MIHLRINKYMHSKEIRFMKKKIYNIFMTAMLLGVSLSLFGCGKSSESASYADGVYTGRSSDFEADESGVGSGYGQVEIEIKDNSIVACTFTMYELDGTIKDDNYGSEYSKENRLKAQKAVQSAGKYAASLVEKGSVDKVDAISGATISYNEFTEAVNDALSKAKK